MTAVLVDTHAFLFFVFGSPRLTDTARAAIESEERSVVLSVASLWEISIKLSLGKLSLGTSLDDFLQNQIENRALDILPIRNAHLLSLAVLPFHHRDPFDRMLIAQALTEGFSIVTGDGHFVGYGVDVIW